MARHELINWEISGYYPYVPQLAVIEPKLGNSITGWIPAEVPGSIHSDLFKAGWIDDPYFDMNSLKCEWVENRWWVYRNIFNIKLKNGARYHLHMNGLDYKCRIYLNNSLLLIHEGSFIPVDIDITDTLQSENNYLQIVFESAPDEESQAGHASHTHTQKSRFSYKWDFSTRMVPVGIWDDIWIETTGDGIIDDVWLIPELMSNKGKLTLRANCVFNTLNEHKEYEIKCGLYLENNCIAENHELFSFHHGMNRADMEVWIDDPKKWYPNGLGEQPLYQVRIDLCVDRTLSHQWQGKIGFKDLEWIQNEKSPNDSLPYCMQVNGERMYIKGVNLTPFDMLIGTVDEDRYRCFLQQIRAANINLVRVNGVGLIEKECFYDLCDTYGILIWQEFIQTSSSMDRIPPHSSTYLDILGATSKAAIKGKRNHVSLACYSGGNELNDAPHKAATFSNPNIAFLKRLVDEFDTGRMFFPTSSTGPSEFLEFGRQGISHDVHGPWNYKPNEHYLLFNQSDSLLHGELGAEGMSHMDSLSRFLKTEDLVVTSMKENLVWRHHGDWWDTFERDIKLFGSLPDLKKFVNISQMMQAEGIRYALESNRRRKYHNSGSIMWAFNEPFPNVSNTCLVDYYGVPKVAYYAAQDAFSPLHMSLKYEKIIFKRGETFEAEVFMNNSLKETSATWQIQVLNLAGKVLYEFKGCTEIALNSVCLIRTINFPIMDDIPDVILVRLLYSRSGEEANAYNERSELNEYLFSTHENAPFSSLLTHQGSVLEYTQEAQRQVTDDRHEERTYSVTNSGDSVAMFVAPVITGENDFLFSKYSYKCLLPGETRKYRVISWRPGKTWMNCNFVSMF